MDTLSISNAVLIIPAAIVSNAAFLKQPDFRSLELPSEVASGICYTC